MPVGVIPQQNWEEFEEPAMPDFDVSVSNTGQLFKMNYTKLAVYTALEVDRIVWIHFYNYGSQIDMGYIVANLWITLNSMTCKITLAS